MEYASCPSVEILLAERAKEQDVARVVIRRRKNATTNLHERQNDVRQLYLHFFCGASDK